MKQKFQDIPKFNQSSEMVVQLEPVINDDCVYFPVQVVKIPKEQLEEKHNEFGEIIVGDKPVIYKKFPVSKIGLCKRVDIVADRFELVAELIKDVK